MRCKKCGHEWVYTGNSKYYVTCPHCYNKVKVEDKKEENIPPPTNEESNPPPTTNPND